MVYCKDCFYANEENCELREDREGCVNGIPLEEDLRACHVEFVQNDEIYTDYQATAELLIEKGYRKQSGWISAEDELPEGCDSVLVLTRWRDMEVCFFDEDDMLWFYRGGYFGQTEITHWMPLPEPPERKEKP